MKIIGLEALPASRFIFIGALNSSFNPPLMFHQFVKEETGTDAL